MKLRPMFKHYGGKWRLSSRAPAPAHDTIVEPFAGAAGYSLRYGAGRRVLLYDTDPDTVAIWEYLLGASVEDIERLRWTVEPVHARADVRDLGLQRAEMLLVQRWLTTQGSRSNWRMTPSGSAFVKNLPGSYWSDRTINRIQDQLSSVAKWEVHWSSYADAPDIKAVWHIDPPYQSNKDAQAEYKHASIDYGVLAAWCKARRGQVMVHEQHGADWLPFETLDVRARTGRQTSAGENRQHEVWWTNGNA